MSYSGNVPTAGWHSTLLATHLVAGRDEEALEQEAALSWGISARQPKGTKLTEAWFVTVREAKRAFTRMYARQPDQLLFTAEEAARVAALPQMQHHVRLWERYVGPQAILPCGLPHMVYGMRVEVR